MADTFNLSVLTPTKKVFEGPVDTFTAPGFGGDFGVLPGHVAYITAVTPGGLVIEGKDGRSVYAVGDGFAQVSPEKVSLLVSEALPIDEVDRAQTRQDLTDAEGALLHATPGDDEYNLATTKQALALGRMAALDRARG